MYFNNDLKLLKQCLSEFKTAGHYELANKKRESQIIDEIANSDAQINTELYKTYSNNLRKAVESVFAEDNDSGLSDRLKANVSRFAAYKSYNATTEIKGEIVNSGSIDDATAKLHKYNRWQAAEYNTTVARCRSAKQFEAFAEPENMELFPNIRWLPSRSASQREEHVKFYNRVWAKTDPFWNENQPGNLWNCKCDWEETDDDITDENPTTATHHNGLEGNPAVTGEVFTDRASYIRKAGKNKAERDRVEKACEAINRDTTISNHQLSGETTTCKIGTKSHEVEFNQYCIKEYAQSLFGNKKLFWLKNEILKEMPDYIKEAKYLGYKPVDLTHNTNKTRLRFKQKLDYYTYFESALPNGEKIYLQLCRFKNDGVYSLYTVSKNIPQDIIKKNVP